MSQDIPFDRRLRRLRRARAARLFHKADYLHRAVADELLDRLELVTRPFARALILGWSGEDVARRLLDRGCEAVLADPALAFVRRACGVQCDEDRLAFADAAFDLVVSIGVLDSVNDLPGALLLIRRTLRPDGLFLGAFAGAGSLPQLRRAMLAADAAEGGASPRVHPQIDVRSAGDLLARAGFTLAVADSQRIDVRYPGLLPLVADLRAMGATNVLQSRGRSLGRLGLAAAIAEFGSDAGADGKTTERFEIVHVSGWTPSPDQPKPARRGSATASLAAVLGRKP